MESNFIKLNCHPNPATDYLNIELEGFVVTRYDHFVKTKKINVMEASHPIPDLNGYNATKKIIQIAKNTSKDDLEFTNIKIYMILHIKYLI